MNSGWAKQKLRNNFMKMVSTDVVCLLRFRSNERMKKKRRDIDSILKCLYNVGHVMKCTCDIFCILFDVNSSTMPDHFEIQINHTKKFIFPRFFPHINWLFN